MNRTLAMCVVPIALTLGCAIDTKSEEEAVTTTTKVQFAGSFHLGGTITSSNAGQFEVDFVDSGNWNNGNVTNNPNTWDDPNGIGEIHFSDGDLGPAGGFVLWSPSGRAVHGSYVVGYWCINTATGTGRATGASTSWSGTTFVALTCNSGEYSALFTGTATFRAGS